jgi:hypothetical protein
MLFRSRLGGRGPQPRGAERWRLSALNARGTLSYYYGPSWACVTRLVAAARARGELPLEISVRRAASPWWYPRADLLFPGGQRCPDPGNERPAAIPRNRSGLPVAFTLDGPDPDTGMPFHDSLADPKALTPLEILILQEEADDERICVS